MGKLLVAFLCALLVPLLHAQSATVTADAGPDENMTQAYMALDGNCRRFVGLRGDGSEAIAACKKVAEEADKFPARSHYITRRAAYVFYTTALIQGMRYPDAVAVGDKAVAVVMLGHDDASGSSAAFGVRGQAKADAGDLAGGDRDLEQAEIFERNGLHSPAGQALSFEYTRTLKGLLVFHAQVLAAMGKQSAADAKFSEAKKL